MKNYPTLFLKENGYVIPRVNPEVNWAVGSFSSLAFRLYDGVTLKLRNNKWHYNEPHWQSVKGNFFKPSRFPYQNQLKEALQRRPINYPGELAIFSGKYELIGPEIEGISQVDCHKLVALDLPEMLPDITRDLWDHIPTEAFYAIKEHLTRMTDVDGIIIKFLNPNSFAQLKRSDFDAL